MNELEEQIKQLNINNEIKNNPIYLLQDIGNNQYKIQNKVNNWKKCVFEKINKLKNDYSGKVGELLLFEICKLTKINCEYNEDINSKNGTYDLIIKSKKIEIKTARCSISGSFQHENLRNDGCDYHIFIDIMPNYYYITILPKFDLKQKCIIMNRTPHLRSKTTGVYKFDFSKKNIINSIKQGYSIEINNNTSLDEINIFINNIVK
jgi:hypothetical protein